MGRGITGPSPCFTFLLNDFRDLSLDATGMQLFNAVIIRAETTVGASAGIRFSLATAMVDAGSLGIGRPSVIGVGSAGVGFSLATAIAGVVLTLAVRGFFYSIPTSVLGYCIRHVFSTQKVIFCVWL